MSTNLEYRARERQRKREKRRQASEAHREKGRQRSRARDKERRHFFVGRTTWKFRSRGDKMRNSSGHQLNARWRWAAVKKSEREHVRHFLRSFWKFHVLVDRAKQRQRNLQKSVVHVQSCFFANYTYRCFYLSPALPSPLSITRFYILFLNEL